MAALRLAGGRIGAGVSWGAWFSIATGRGVGSALGSAIVRSSTERAAAGGALTEDSAVTTSGMALAGAVAESLRSGSNGAGPAFSPVEWVVDEACWESSVRNCAAMGVLSDDQSGN